MFPEAKQYYYLQNWFEPYLRRESYSVKAHYENKQLMPGQKRNGEFCFLETLHDHQGKAILLFTKLNYWFEPYMRKESYTVTAHYENKQLTPGQKRNGEFCFLETFHDPQAKAKGNIEIEGNKTHCFLQGQSLSVLLYLPTHKYTKKKL